MLWFQGSVSEAIAESKRNRSVFIVYIYKDDDEPSRKMNTVWESDQITEACLADCTGIKLHADSNELKQFASIYPVVSIPCVYLIGGDGMPLEVIAMPQTAEQFLDKVKLAVQKHRVKFPKVEPTFMASSSAASSSLPSESLGSSSHGEGEESSNSEPALAERVARAKKLIEDKKKEKAEQEKEKTRKKELERRKEGQMLSKAQTEREEKLAQQMVERIKTEKAKDKAAREAIRQKIAQDKAERAAREEVEKQERLNIAARIDPRVVHNESNVQCSEVRLQFRLPDGSSVTKNFPSDAVLDAAREFICSKKNFQRQITFWTTFPRKRLGDEDFRKTLGELGLAPSAALIVDPTSQNTSRGSIAAGTASSFSSFFTLILSPLFALLSFLKLLLFSSSQQSQVTAEQRDSSQNTTTSTASTPSTLPSDIRRRRQENDKNEDRFKKDGKIHSFNQNEDDDDENNTWNGNSTQQM